MFFTCLARSKNAARAATKRSEDDLSDDEGDMGVFDDDGTAAQQDDDADDDAFFDWYVLGMHLQVVARLTIPLRWCCFYPGMTMWTCERACCVWVCCQSTRQLERCPHAITPSETSAAGVGLCTHSTGTIAEQSHNPAWGWYDPCSIQHTTC